jgi:hypothetical protein
MTTPPRIAERLLGSLGAPAALHDAVLGDLAEEFAERAARDGHLAARRWYRLEALRSAPHLLWSGGRALGLRGLLHLCGVALSAYVLVLIVALLTTLTTTTIAGTMGLGSGPSFAVAVSRSDTFLVFAIVLGVLAATVGGYVAAWLETRTPLLASVTLGALSVIAQLVGVAVQSQPVTWYQALAPLLVLAATTTGGILRVRRAT